MSVRQEETLLGLNITFLPRGNKTFVERKEMRRNEVEKWKKGMWERSVVFLLPSRRGLDPSFLLSDITTWKTNERNIHLLGDKLFSLKRTDQKNIWHAKEQFDYTSVLSKKKKEILFLIKKHSIRPSECEPQRYLNQNRK